LNTKFCDILNLLKTGKYLVTLHAKQRMASRNVSHADIKRCAATGSAVETDGKIKVTGLDCDDEELHIICVYEDGIIIITVF
jgi:hypothetical protein